MISRVPLDRHVPQLTKGESMKSPIENVQLKTSRSNDMLERARRYLEQASQLPAGDDKRSWLEEEAQRLISEARELTESAKKQVSKYK